MSVILDMSNDMLVAARHEENNATWSHLHVTVSRFTPGMERMRRYRSLRIIWLCSGNDSDVGGQFLNFPIFPYISKNVVPGKKLDSMGTMSAILTRPGIRFTSRAA